MIKTNQFLDKPVGHFSFKKYVVSTYDVPGIVPGSYLSIGYSNEQNRSPCTHGAYILGSRGARDGNKINVTYVYVVTTKEKARAGQGWEAMTTG